MCYFQNLEGKNTEKEITMGGEQSKLGKYHLSDCIVFTCMLAVIICLAYMCPQIICVNVCVCVCVCVCEVCVCVRCV